jgi:predicted histone-like DNA-binding protein
MAIKFRPVNRVNPQDVAAPQKFYATAVGDGRTDFKRLAKLISMQSTVSKADCLAVLSSLEENVIMELQEGRIVDLGELGTFQVGILSEGRETFEEVNANVVKSARLRFRPGKEFKRMLKAGLEFQKIN